METPNNNESEIIHLGNDLNNIGSNTSLNESAEATARRRSSNRSIKRKKFDDELVEYSLGVPGISNMKSGRSKTQSYQSEFAAVASSSSSSTTNQSIIPPLAPAVLQQHHLTSSSSSDTNKRNKTNISKASSHHHPSSSSATTTTTTTTKGKNKKNTTKNHLTTKDLGRWKPIDDLALIIGVQQTSDLKTVHLGTKFSCKFTLPELQSRWYALLYDQAVSRVAVSAMRNLHPDMIAAVQDKALWSQEEETLLNTIKSSDNPTPETFGELLSKHTDTFYNGRSANSLFRHWQSLKMYHLLADQTVGPIPTLGRPVLTFNDAEEMLLQDVELTDPPDEALDRELKLQQRKNIKEIRQLENEVGRWNVLVDSLTGNCPGELDSQTLAVLRGRMVRYLMRSREISIGRSGKGSNVDIDLSLEGPAHKISRRQATLRLRNTGEFYLSSEGKRPIFVDGKPISAGTKVRLYDNAVVEIACLRFIFSINHDLIRAIHNESVRYNLPP